MKKVIGILVLVLSMFSCTQTKTGYVDVEEILKEYKGSKDAEKEMNDKSGQIKTQLDAMAADYQKKVASYYEKAPKMSKQANQEAQNVLMQEKQALEQRQQQAQVDVQKDVQDRMAEINENIEDFVKNYAKKNGYTYILGTSEQTRSVLYGDSKLDLTDTILEGLNDEYKNDKPSKKEEESEE